MTSIRNKLCRSQRKEHYRNNLRQRQFLESWHSEADNNSINERKELPRVYKAFVKQNA